METHMAPRPISSANSGPPSRNLIGFATWWPASKNRNPMKTLADGVFNDADLFMANFLVLQSWRSKQSRCIGTDWCEIDAEILYRSLCADWPFHSARSQESREKKPLTSWPSSHRAVIKLQKWHWGDSFQNVFVFKIIQNSKLFIFCPQLWQVLLGFFAFPSWERPQLLTVPQCLSYSCLIPVHLWQPCAYLTFCRVRGPELHDNVGCSWRSKNSKEQMYGPMLTRYNGSAFISKSVCCTLFSSSCFFSLCQYCCY